MQTIQLSPIHSQHGVCIERYIMSSFHLLNLTIGIETVPPFSTEDGGS